MAYLYCDPLDIQMIAGDAFVRMSVDDNENGTVTDAADNIPNDPLARTEWDAYVGWAIRSASLEIETFLSPSYVVGTYGTDPDVEAGNVHPQVREWCALLAVRKLEARRLCSTGPGIDSMIEDARTHLQAIHDGFEELQPFWEDMSLPPGERFIGVAPQTSEGRSMDGAGVSNYGVAAASRHKVGVRKDISTNDPGPGMKRPTVTVRNRRWYW